MYLKRQQEETKRKQQYVLFSLLLSLATCMSSTPTLCSNVWVFSLCVLWNTWPHFSIMQCCWFTPLRELKESQKSKKLEIVAKILQEEQLLKRRSKAPAPNLSSHDKFSTLRLEREVLLSYLEPNPPSAPPSPILVRRSQRLWCYSVPLSSSTPGSFSHFGI